MKRIIKALAALALAAGLCLSLKWAAADLYDSRTLSPEEHLYRSLMEEQSCILVAGCGLSDEALGKVWDSMIYSRGDLFFVGDYYEYLTVGNTVLYVKPQYDMTGEALAQARVTFDRAMEEILAAVDPGWSPVQTALYLHDVLCARYAYDESLTRYTAYELLTEGTGVCQGYTLAYSYLLNACGIPCSFAASGEMNHVWNVVTIDGKAYNVDLTFDDPTNHPPGRVSHRYFMVSDEGLGDSHSFTADEGFGQCVTDYDDPPWATATSAFVPMDGGFYYIDKGIIRFWDGSQSRPVMTIYATWFTDHGDGSYWEGNHSSLWAAGDLLLYNMPDRIVSLDPRTGITQTVYGYKGEGDIYGFLCADGKLTLEIGTSPNERGTLVEADVDL